MAQPKAAKATSKVPTVYVTVEDTTYPPGEPLPAEVAKLVDNPKVFGEQVEAEEPEGSDSADD